MNAELCHLDLTDIGCLLDRPPRPSPGLWLVDVCGLTYAQAAAENGTNPKRFAKTHHAARTTIRKAVT